MCKLLETAGCLAASTFFNGMYLPGIGQLGRPHLARWRATAVGVLACVGVALAAGETREEPAAPPESPPTATNSEPRDEYPMDDASNLRRRAEPPAPSAQPSTRRSGDRVLIYFPPIPPRLWAPLPPISPVNLRNAAPPEMAEFINEPFYAPLATRLADRSLTPALKTRLEAYQDEKTALQRELLAKYESLEDLPPSTRETELIAFAQTQSPRVAKLEAEAEQLRTDLIRNRDDWNAHRQWRLGSTPFTSSSAAMSAQYQVLRAAAYYQRGLSPAQRRLLREIVMDMENLIDLPLMGNELAPDLNPLLAFSPETSRLRLPAPLTPELSELVSTYERAKAELKQELRSAIYDEDRTWFGFVRNHRLEQLARKQESRLAALDILAEKVRQALVAAPNQPRTPTIPSVPPAIGERFTEYLYQREDLQRQIFDLLARISTFAELERIAVAPGSGDNRYELRISVRPGPREKEQIAMIKERLTVFNQSHADRKAALDAELQSIRQGLLWLSGDGETEAGRRTVDLLIEEFIEAHDQVQRWEKYREYRLAVLEPGLSPEQRRLLYSSALVNLQLPLPSGSLQPSAYGGPGARSSAQRSTRTFNPMNNPTPTRPWAGPTESGN